MLRVGWTVLRPVLAAARGQGTKGSPSRIPAPRCGRAGPGRTKSSSLHTRLRRVDAGGAACGAAGAPASCDNMTTTPRASGGPGTGLSPSPRAGSPHPLCLTSLLRVRFHAVPERDHFRRNAARGAHPGPLAQSGAPFICKHERPASVIGFAAFFHPCRPVSVWEGPSPCEKRAGVTVADSHCHRGPAHAPKAATSSSMAFARPQVRSREGGEPTLWTLYPPIYLAATRQVGKARRNAKLV